MTAHGRAVALSMTNPECEAIPVEPVAVQPPPTEQRVRRDARFVTDGEKPNRYHLPSALRSSSPVGFRHRVQMSRAEVAQVLPLLHMAPPTAFADGQAPSEQELFEESSLGILTARQSTNYRGHRQTTLGPTSSARVADLLRQLGAPALDGATHSHIVLSRPYRTPFTFLLTFIGHRPWKSLLTVPRRALLKRFKHVDDIPTIAYLQHVHLGILADAMERATVIASQGVRRAHIHLAPFCDRTGPAPAALRELEKLAGMTAADRRAGWRIALVAQVGNATEQERYTADESTWRRLGANMLAMRSERIQPGVNAEDKAPAQYQERQNMDIPDELSVQAGRAAYNAFCRWTGCGRQAAKDLLLLERVDVLTPGGKQRLRDVRDMLGEVTDRVMTTIPLWADLPTGKALSRNAARGKKAFGLAGQRIYIGGLSRPEVMARGLGWELALRAFGAAAARSALIAEWMGVMDLPDDCDLLAGICLMAGPVNQNDIGKEFYGHQDLLESAFPGRSPTSLLVWTLKAKTVADPIGNEEQLLNPARKGALVDLRPGPHEVIAIERPNGGLAPMRSRGDEVNNERAFGDVGNFVTAPDGTGIPGNNGAAWRGEPDGPYWT